VTPYYQDSAVKIFCGDCRDVLPEIGPVDSVVTDPPYGLRFMGKAWDYDVPDVALWRLVLAACKPGAHLLSFAGTRTQHRMAVNIEDAGFEIRDMIAWVYGSGFPKSLDVSKAIDKAAGVDVSRDGYIPNGKNNTHGKGWGGGRKTSITAPATDAAKQWAGWGTALKPALEPITVARRPLIGTVAENVLAHGTGALNIAACRVGLADGDRKVGGFGAGKVGFGGGDARGVEWTEQTQGRWPANLIHDGSDEVVAMFPGNAGGGTATRGASSRIYGGGKGFTAATGEEVGYGDSGSAARFFYCAKASKADRDEGCEGLEAKNNMRVNAPRKSEDEKHATRLGNFHPTVKPCSLMRYLCRLVTPPGGIILDPFMGSGSTGKAAIAEGFRFIGIERDIESCVIAVARLKHAMANRDAQEVLPL